MDLGSLELQIFVSLTVVLGGALIALICDYLKGNNEQLREHNIELRVRREEQERRLLLDQAAYLNRVSSARSAVEVEDEGFIEDGESQPAPRRRAGRSRGGRRGRNGRTSGERVNDPVRPEVLERVARQAESEVAASQDAGSKIEVPRPEPQLQPLNAADHWDIRDQLPSRGKTERPEPVTEAPNQVEEIEQVAQAAAQAPGVILRPLTVPALKLEDEIQRVAEAVAPPPPAPALAPMPISWSSPLLEEVIAASAEQVTERPIAVIGEPAPAAAGEVLHSGYDIAAREYPVAKTGTLAELEYIRGTATIELPVAQLRLTDEPALAEPVEEQLPALLAAVESEPLELPTLVALDEIQVEPPPFWLPPVAAEAPVAELVEIEAIRAEIEEAKEAEVEHYADLVLPVGMQDLATWNRLLELPNPVSGYVVMVKVEVADDTNAPAAESIPELVENLMRSLLREGDFGCQIGDSEWVFIYGHDTTGLNQRRVGMVSEKLWDFKLRNINLTNVTFKWGAVDVKSEPLLASIDAARSRLYATRRNRMLPGAHGVGPRWVVNG